MSRNGAVPHGPEFDYVHAPHMYNLDAWPGKKAFVASMVAGITLGGLFVVPAVLVTSHQRSMRGGD